MEKKSNGSNPDFNLAITIGGIKFIDIMHDLAHWLEDAVQKVEEGGIQTFRRAGNFKLVGSPRASFSIHVEIRGLRYEEK